MYGDGSFERDFTFVERHRRRHRAGARPGARASRSTTVGRGKPVTRERHHRVARARAPANPRAAPDAARAAGRHPAHLGLDRARAGRAAATPPSVRSRRGRRALRPLAARGSARPGHCACFTLRVNALRRSWYMAGVVSLSAIPGRRSRAGALSAYTLDLLPHPAVRRARRWLPLWAVVAPRAQRGALASRSCLALYAALDEILQLWVSRARGVPSPTSPGTRSGIAIGIVPVRGVRAGRGRAAESRSDEHLGDRNRLRRARDRRVLRRVRHARHVRRQGRGARSRALERGRDPDLRARPRARSCAATLQRAGCASPPTPRARCATRCVRLHRRRHAASAPTAATDLVVRRRGGAQIGAHARRLQGRRHEEHRAGRRPPSGCARRSPTRAPRPARRRPLSVASNPEFLREGAPIEDFLRPDRVVIGAEDDARSRSCSDLYRPLYLIEVPFVVTNVADRGADQVREPTRSSPRRSAFINEIVDALRERSAPTCTAVARAWASTAGSARKFLHPGPGYGGSCFPEGHAALVQFSREFGVEQRIVRATVAANERQRARMIVKIEQLRRQRARARRSACSALVQAEHRRRARLAGDLDRPGAAAGAALTCAATTRRRWRTPRASSTARCSARTRYDTAQGLRRAGLRHRVEPVPQARHARS